MENHEQRPLVGEMGRVLLRVTVQVAVHGERYVFEHHQEVGDRQSGQDQIGGPSHLLRRQHADVENVGDGAEDADEEAERAVHLLVCVVKVLKVAVNRGVVHDGRRDNVSGGVREFCVFRDTERRILPVGEIARV